MPELFGGEGLGTPGTGLQETSNIDTAAAANAPGATSSAMQSSLSGPGTEASSMTSTIIQPQSDASAALAKGGSAFQKLGAGITARAQQSNAANDAQFNTIFGHAGIASPSSPALPAQQTMIGKTAFSVDSPTSIGSVPMIPPTMSDRRAKRDVRPAARSVQTFLNQLIASEYTAKPKRGR